MRDKQQEDLAAIRDRRQTPADFSSIYSKGESGCSGSRHVVQSEVQSVVQSGLEASVSDGQHEGGMYKVHVNHKNRAASICKLIIMSILRGLCTFSGFEHAKLFWIDT